MNIANPEMKKCCFTGYRPSKFPFLLSSGNAEYKAFENRLISEIFSLPDEENCCVFYSGMAMGFDIIAAEAVLLLKKTYTKAEIRLVCIQPFKGQEETYNEEWHRRYFDVLKECDDIVCTSEEYFAGCYQRRNRYMVDNCDYVLTWYDGKPGGTRNTLNYAVKKRRCIINLNDDYELTDNKKQLQLSL